MTAPADDVIHDEMLLELVCDLLQGGREACFIARGSSMHPTIRDGDRVVVRPCSAAHLLPGMIALCLIQLPDGGRGMVIHRFLGRNPDETLRFTGDACPRPDPAVPGASVAGQVIEVRRGRGAWRASHWPGSWLLARSTRVPRLLARFSRCGFSRRGRYRLPLIPVPPGRMLREQRLLQMATGDQEALLSLDDGEEALRLEPDEADLLPLILCQNRHSAVEPGLISSQHEAAEIEACLCSARAETALSWLARAMEAANHELLLTGAAGLAWSHYPEPHCRLDNTVECLVKPEQREAVIEALLRSGAALGIAGRSLSHCLRCCDATLLRLPGPGWPALAIRWRGAAPSWHGLRCSSGRFWEANRESAFGPALRLMAVEAAIVQTFLAEAAHYPAPRLTGIVDLALLARAAPDWERVLAWLRQERSVLPAAVIAKWATSLLPAALPRDVVLRLEECAGQTSSRLAQYIFAHPRSPASRGLRWLFNRSWPPFSAPR